MTAPLVGLRVLDLTSGPAGGLATMVLADFGARVIRYPDPEYDELNQVVSARMWLRGKKNASRPMLDAVREADVVVVSIPNSFDGSDFDTLHRINPRLVYAEVRAFAEGPEVTLSEPLVAARLGRMLSMDGILQDPGPRYSAVQVATHATAQNLVTGILAALFERNRSGVGQKVSTCLAKGLSPYDMGGSLGMQLRKAPPVPVNPAAIMPTLNYHPVQCSDGRWLQLGNLLPHLFASFMRAIGLETEMSKLPEEQEAVRDAILLKMQSRPLAEWMALFVSDGGIAAHPYQSAEEALADPDMTENGHVAEFNGTRQLGPLARLTATPAAVGDMPTGEPWTLPTPADVAPDSAPLRGITVLELATIIAAPLGASFLADLGARVIKVETVGGDPFRNMGGGVGSARCNQGKESIGVDLKSPEGRAIVDKLVRQADILIHNFRPGVPERLGIGYAELSAINPRLVYISANGYGPDGPGALRPSTHPIPGAAMGGAAYQAGGLPTQLLPLPALREQARRIMRANEVNPDPNTAMVIASSALLGLMARERTGTGQQIFGDMFIANAYANFDDMITFEGKPERAPLRPDLSGAHALCRLYACESGQVFLDLHRLADWQAFCRLVGAMHLSSHYPDPLPAPPEVLNEELEVLFASRPADHWEDLLFAAGIGCVVADRHNLPTFFFNEARPGSPYMEEVRDSTVGSYYRHRPMLDFSRSRLKVRGMTPGGAQTTELLLALGYDSNTISKLFEDGVLWSENRS
ncbi:MAG: CoA transferase [Pseudomonadota bacterium]